MQAEYIKNHLQSSPGDINAIINSIKDGIAVTDIASKVILLNSSSALLKKNEYELIYGRTLFELIALGIMIKPNKSELEVIVNNIKKGQTVQFELILKDNEKPFITMAYPIYKQSDKVYRILYTSNDKLNRFIEIANYHSKSTANSPTEAYSTQPESEIGFKSRSESMKPIISIASKVAIVDSPVFLTGETGVGKSLLARYIHNISNRKNEPFIQVNCSAIPHNLFESEIFGYEQGAFTGASRQRKLGLMELAGEGTIFLDEITELNPVLQAKLLQVMQEGEFWRLGGSVPIPFKARVISATNQNISYLVKNKMFREDLYYRICVITIDIPPLRERIEDIILLAEDFINQFNKKYRTNKYLNPEVILWLNRYQWPGNVRELRNVIERMAIVSDTDDIKLIDIPNSLEHENNNSLENLTTSLKEANERLEKSFIQKVLFETKNYKEAADALCISQSTLMRKIQKYGLKNKESNLVLEN